MNLQQAIKRYENNEIRTAHIVTIRDNPYPYSIVLRLTDGTPHTLETSRNEIKNYKTIDSAVRDLARITNDPQPTLTLQLYNFKAAEEQGRGSRESATP